MSSSAEDKVLNLNLHFGTKEIPAKVGMYDSIKALDPILPAPCKIIYNSVVLSPAFSFSFYEIKNGSHLMLIPYQPEKKKKQIVYNQKEDNRLIANLMKVDREKCRMVFRKVHGADYDEEQFEQSYRAFLDPGLSKEAALIKDRFFTRVEGTIKAHRKLLRQFFQIKKKEETKKCEIRISESPSSEPSSLPIEFPCFWT